MDILVTTIGLSWQIVPELYGIFNPEVFGMFKGNAIVRKLHEKGCLESIDEIWVVTSEKARTEHVLERIQKWGAFFPVHLRFFVCPDALDFSSESQILSMRSVILQTVFNASRKRNKNDKLFISLSGGTKNMSADIQQAGYLFGCHAMLHIMDLDTLKPVKEQFRNDDLVQETEHYASCFLPFVIAEDVPENEIIPSLGSVLDCFHFPSLAPSFSFMNVQGDMRILNIIQDAQKKSSILLSNFSTYVHTDSCFRNLYFLPKKTIDHLKTTRVVDAPKSLLDSLPKCDLHTHLGGVLTPEQTIRVAMAERNVNESLYPDDTEVLRLVKKKDVDGLITKKKGILSTSKGEFLSRFHSVVSFLCAFQGEKELLERVIYDDLDTKPFIGVGIENYQRYGDLQGSGLLQTERTIREAIRCYGESLKKDNIKYVELRCSPNKYTRCGLTLEAVARCIIEEMDRTGIDYRLIFIIGRDASIDNMRETAKQIYGLRQKNEAFKKRFVAVDLAGTEGTVAPKEVREAFLPLLEQCMYITIHAGETESVENIWQAVYYLSADRIGHGLKLPNNPELMKRFLDKRIGIELCPSSNIQVVGVFQPEYPLRSFLEQGLKVTVNTDNMGISKTTMTQEFYVAARLFPNLTLWDSLVMIRNSISVSFAGEETKSRLMTMFEKEILEIIEKGVSFN